MSLMNLLNLLKPELLVLANFLMSDTSLTKDLQVLESWDLGHFRGSTR